VTIQENHPPSPKGTYKNIVPATTNRMLLLSKFAFLFTCCLISQQNTSLSPAEIIASFEFSLGNIVSVHAMIEVK